MTSIRVYADTSVFGGVFDQEFEDPSRAFFDQVGSKRFQLVISVNHCRAIVSWNFKHIVHFDKIPLYNGVNLINGFEALSINSPAEVITYEE